MKENDDRQEEKLIPKVVDILLTTWVGYKGQKGLQSLCSPDSGNFRRAATSE